MSQYTFPFIWLRVYTRLPPRTLRQGPITRHVQFSCWPCITAYRQTEQLFGLVSSSHDWFFPTHLELINCARLLIGLKGSCVSLEITRSENSPRHKHIEFLYNCSSATVCVQFFRRQGDFFCIYCIVHLAAPSHKIPATSLEVSFVLFKSINSLHVQLISRKRLLKIGLIRGGRDGKDNNAPHPFSPLFNVLSDTHEKVS